MKKIFLTLLSLSFFSLLSIAQEQCLTDNKHKKLLLEDSSYSQRYYSFFNQVNSNLGLNSNQAFILQGDTDTLEVPLVVHIIHKGEAVGVGSNIADSQIIDAVNVLNDRFRKTPGTHGDGNGVDTKIQFVLAKRAPNCDSTNGIVRVNGSSVAGYSANGITSTNEIQIKALSRWPSSNYVNIWVVSEIDGNNGGFGTQGYAYFPGASPQVDGIVVMNTCFGTIGTVNAWNNLNRTLTHELGHYFGLFHTFEGDSLGNQCPPIVNGCGSDLGDCCGDTEHHIRAASNCPVGINGCTSAAWAGVEDNYMNYSNQSCATDFTANQSARMRATLLSARAGLLTSYGYVDPPLSSITAASCSPNTTNLANNSGIGIRNVSIGDVLNVSTSTAVRDSGYLDFTCTQIISLDTGVAYDIEVLTGFFNDEDVRVYLDYNNDGDFLDTAELIFSNNADTFHQGSFTPYSLLVLNDTLRLRIISDWFNNNITGPCYTPEYGQVEDYAVVFAADSLDSFAVTSTSTQNQSCPDSADGEITITAIGPGPIVYSILGFNNGYADTNLTGQFTDLVPDFYIVSVGDSSLGTDTTFSLTVAPSFFGFLNPPFNQLVDPSCDNACDGDARSRPNVLGTTPYTYLWSNGETSAKAFNLCGGTATVSITDASGCTISQSVTLIEPPSIFVTVDSTDSVTCNGGADGAAYISGHGGTVASDSTNFYIIDQTEGEFEPYGVGESFNTSNYQSFTLGDDQLTGSLNIGFNFEFFGNTQTTFRISSNGNIQFGTAVSNTWQNVSIPNANNPDNWIGVWDDLNPSATTSEVIETYLAGTSPNRARVINYVDVPHFQSGTAQYTFQIVLYETSNIIQIHSTTIPNFNEGGAFPGTTMGIENADGSFGYAVPGRNGVNFSATNDYVTFIPLTQNFTYSWSSIGTGSSATNLTAGTYTVTAADGSCSDTASFTILEPDPITVDSTITNPTCVGDTDGAITVNANGGNGGPFTYAWSTGGNTATISNLAAGTYTVTVTDVEGCTEVIAITLDDPDPVVASINVDDNVSCFGGSDGQLTASGSGGAGGFTYLWNTTASTPTIGSLSAGTYTVTVTDANGCTDVDSEVITEPTLLTFSINSVTNVSCFGGTDGAITANAASGGTTPYTYLWSSGGTALAEGSLSAGTYTITVTDGNGCTATVDTTITEPATGVTISIASATTLECFGDTDASITANAASGGTSPYSYLWSSGGTGLTETGLGAGTYTITVTDAGGCLDSADTTITEPTQLVIDTTSVSGPSCVGGTNGSITVAATGGTPGYTYTWNTTATGPTLSGLSAGTYTVTATDNNGCTDDITIVLTDGPGITAAINIDTAIDCNGNTTGQLTASGANGAAPYTFLWSTTATSATISGLGAGTYTVTVTDNGGCQDSATQILVEPSALVVNMIDSSDVSCLGGNDGSAEVQATGGTSPYTYLWNTGGTNDTIDNKPAGTYTVTVTDANGCTGTAQVTLTQPATGISLVMSSTNVLCFGQLNGTATATPAGGNSPYTYAWSNGGSGPTITGLGAGTYVLTVTDANGCTGVDSATVTAPAFPVIAVTSTDSVSCFGASDGQIQAFLVNGTAPLSYNWSTGDTTQAVTGLTAGTYTVTVTDANGCSDSQTDIVAGPVAISLTMASSDPSCAGATDGTSFVSASGGTPGYTYLWSNGATTDSISGLGEGTFVVTVTDANGCEGIDSVTLTNGNGVQATITLLNDPSCAGTLTGSIAANALNASLPFNVSYIWNTGSTSNLQFSVAAGTYTVTVTDNNTGCEDDTTVTLTDPPVLSISIIDSLNPTCGNTDGEAEALATGGTGSLTYSWSSGGNAALETGLGGGTYTVTVTDANGCLDSAEVTLVAPTAFTATGSELASESCTGNDGQATVNMVGGNMPFSFVWSNGDTTQTIIGLAANTYTVTVTDASGCTDTAVAIVADSCLCNWTASGVLVSDVLCNGDSTGSASVTHAGAANPVTYLWSTGSTNDSLVNVPVGTYTVTVTDNDACVDTAVVVIDEPATALVINSFSNISAPTCDNDCDGNATVNASGGTGTMTYAWSSGGSAASVTGLCGGGHYVTVTDNNGCEAVDLIALVERPVIFAQVDSTDSVSCPGNNDGAAFLSAHGGFATSTNTGEYIIDQTEGSFEPYPTGRPWNAINYKTFPLQDDATSDTINIFSGDTFEFFGVGHTHFIMNSQGFITFDLSNPNSGQVNGQFSATSAIPSAGAATPRDFIAAYWHDLDPSVGNCTLETYLVGAAPNRIRVVNYIEIDHFQSPNGSGDISTFQIVLYENSNIIQIHSDSLNSDGGNHVQGIENFAGTQAYSVPGRNNTNFNATNDYVAFIPITQDFTYTWSSIGSGPSDTTLTAGNYTVTASDGTCEDTVQFEIFEPANGLSVTMSALNSFCFVATGQAIANVSNGVGPYTYAWSNSTTNNSALTSDTITGLSSGPYSVTVTDAQGCEDSNSVTVNDSV